VLLMFSSQVSHASRILGVWCLFLAMRFLAHFLAIDGELNAFTWLIGWNFFIPASYGALMYLYCKYALISAPFKWKEMLHFTPFIFCYLINYDIMFLSAEDKLQMTIQNAAPSFTVLVAQAILFAQAFIYIALSAALIWRCRLTASRTLSNYNPDVFNWLWKLITLDCVIWTLKLSGLFFGHIFPFFFVGDILIFFLIYTIALAQWRNPRLFTIDQLTSDQIDSAQSNSSQVDSSQVDSSQVDSSQLDSAQIERGQLEGQQLEDGQLKNNQKQAGNAEPSDSHFNDANEDKPNKGALDYSIGQQLLRHIQQQMEQQQLFLDSELTLIRLADACGVSTHHLSEVLNQHNGKNFYRFVNEYRVAYICQQLNSDVTHKILDLALRSGFSSKSTFNAVFKQIQGVTPSQYKIAI
jgi:AraC-like DNA-binding protein